MSTTPERSDHRPARQAQDQRHAEPDAGAEDADEGRRKLHARSSPQIGGWVVRRASSVATGPTEHVLERAGEQHHQALDDDDHVAADLRLVERELGAALVEHAEQDRREHDADRMRAAHQRDRDADEAEAGGEFEDQPMLLAEDHVGRHAAGERARQQRRDDGDARRRNAAVDRRGRVGADGADFVAEPRAPDQHPDAEGGGEREQERQVERRHRPDRSRAASTARGTAARCASGGN